MSRAESPLPTLTVGMVHPEMGVGGAERVIAGAAEELVARGHRVLVFATRYTPNNTLLPPGGPVPVHVHGDWLPRSILGHMRALCAGLRLLALAAWLYVFCTRHFDVLVVDQVSLALPILRLCADRVVFYCHFPDTLVASQQRSAAPRRSLLSTLGALVLAPLRFVYRRAFDGLEEWGLGYADAVVANSRFTADAYARAFPALAVRRPASVLYPGVPVPAGPLAPSHASSSAPAFAGRTVVLSINRFERKKDLALAVRAFADVRRDTPDALLVLAGGYDRTDAENRDVLRALRALCDELALRHETSAGLVVPETLSVAHERSSANDDFGPPEVVCNGRPWRVAKDTSVVFLPAVHDDVRTRVLLRPDSVACLVYTPANEHFGLVPLEAMAAGVIVVARDSGGPRETIVDGKTGFLCATSGAVNEIARALRKVLRLDAQERAAMSVRAAEHVRASFSLFSFGERLESILGSVVSHRRPI